MSIRIKTNEFNKDLSSKTHIQHPILYQRHKPWLKTTVYKCINVNNFPKNSLIIVEQKLYNGDYSGCIVIQINKNLYNETNSIKCIEIDLFRETLRRQIEVYDRTATVIPYDNLN